MGGLSSNASPDLDIREQISRIDRNQAEVRKLQAEVNRLLAEEAKFSRARILAPVLAAALGGFVAALVPTILRGWGLR